MKKITLLFILCLTFNFVSYAQDTCLTATPITAGTYTVAAVNGTEGTTIICSGGTTAAAAAEWYSYTPTVDGSATISSNILPANMNGDTRIQVYQGTCGALSCFAGSDDVDYPGANYLSEVTFNTTANVTYIIAWDNRWSSFGFEFTLTEAAAVCIDPSGFLADDSTTTTFDLSWTDSNTGTPTWEIEWGADNFTQGNGTLISNILTANYQFTALTPNTNYDFFIRANCGGSNGDSAWVGPVGFRSQRDCSNSAAFPYSENFVDGTILDCWEIENIDATTTSPWTLNTGTNDLDGDGVEDNFMVIFPQAATELVKNDWLFSNKMGMVAGSSYDISVLYNGFDFNTTTANESFELIVVDEQSSTAAFQSVIGTYSGITQSGAFGDATGNDLVTQAYTANETFTPTSSGVYYVAVRATTPAPAASASLFMLFNLSVNGATLGVEDFGNKPKMSVYPNPANDIVNIKTELTIDSIEVVNMLGQTVKTIEGKTITNNTINVSAFKSGLYFLNITAEGKKQTIKIIKE